MPRKTIGKKLRFEVFKRDAFACQYCGKKAPDVILHVDHILPVSKGGQSDLLNLITACVDCNLGKSNRELSDRAALAKQRAQLDELNGRREQLEMLVRWREELERIADQEVEALQKRMESKITGFSLNDRGISDIRDWLKRFTVAELLVAIDVSADRYVCINADGKVPQEAAENFHRKIPGIAWNSRQPDEEQAMRYARGILRNRIRYCDDRRALDLMKRAYAEGMTVEEMTDLAKQVRHWSEWRSYMEGFING